jgi:hypothetical protein
MEAPLPVPVPVVKAKKKRLLTKADRLAGRLALAAIGLEAEFKVVVDGKETTPERVWGTPQAFVRQRLVHREGRSYHLPTGGAVYFDTGVIEVATPPIEVAPGCAERAGRSLWEAIQFVRDELDAWEARTGRTVRLVGFSAHYNVSFEAPTPRHRVEDLAFVLAHVLPAPMMLVAANRRSTGVGVRPRGNRIEVTVDFTPDAALSCAAAALVTGVVRAVMHWPSYHPHMLQRVGVPVITGFCPMPHTSRQGWLAHASCYAQNPFEAGPNARVWDTTAGGPHALRDIARVVFGRFRGGVRALAEPATLRLLDDLMAGRAPALLDLPERPAAYDDVGRACRWEALFPPEMLARSRYEEVLIHAVRGDVLRLGPKAYRPTRPVGWGAFAFRDDAGARHTFTMDYLLAHARHWQPAIP